MIAEPHPKPRPWSYSDPVPKKDPNRIDSGVRFSSLSGDVSVKRKDQDDDHYEFAQMDMILYQGDMIRKTEKSGATLSFADLSTYVIGEESRVILNAGDDKSSKVSLVLGNLMTNVKKMLTTGNIDIEMNHAVAGIKGTILVCKTDGQTSSVKVLEGGVVFTPTGQKSLSLRQGQQASVSATVS